MAGFGLLAIHCNEGSVGTPQLVSEERTATIQEGEGERMRSEAYFVWIGMLLLAAISLPRQSSAVPSTDT